MHDSADRLDFAPPPQPAAVRAFLLAILAHVLLILALTWGINWDRDSQDAAAEAELWSSVPPQPEPKVEPKVVQAPPLPAPPPQPVPKVEPPPAPPVTKEPDIALEQEKKRRELAERKQEELERQKVEAARKKREELELEKKQEARKREEEQRRQAAAEQKALEEKKKKEEQAQAAREKAREQAEAKAAQARREANLSRMRNLAGTGPVENNSNGAGGPSTSYAAKIAARIRPNIRHPQDVPGNPPVIIEVKTSPDGTIVGQRVVKSSGNSAWDESAIRAIIATGSLPRDTDGRVHSPIEVSVRQRD
jgi:colicin import membrane protein